MNDDKTISINTDTPALFVDLSHPELEFSERGFILLPGEQKELILSGNLKKSDLNRIKIFTLNQYLKR
jgi:hypothetical protein